MKKSFAAVFVFLVLLTAVYGQEDKPRRFPGPPPGRMGNWGRGEEIVVIMGKMKKEEPEKFKKLDALRKSNPQQFVEEIKPLLPKPGGNFKIFASIDTESKALAKQLKNATDPAEKEKLQAQLKAKIKEGFDLMLQNADERLDRLKKHVEALRESEDFVLEERYNNLMQ